MTWQTLRDALAADVVEGSRLLLGATLIKGGMSARIAETEAYHEDDPACHAFGKSRMKNMALWSHPGNSYVYFTYGCHWMLNVVALEHGVAAAALIRAAEPLTGLDEMRRNRGVDDPKQLLSGPGKLARAFGLDASWNDLPLLGPEAGELRIEPAHTTPERIEIGVRIGIAEGKGHETPWRFLDGSRLEWASRPLPPELRKNNRLRA